MEGDEKKKKQESSNKQGKMNYNGIPQVNEKQICVCLIIPWEVDAPGYHGRFSLRGNNEGYIGNVVKGSISHNDTLGCLSPAVVDSSQPTYKFRKKGEQETIIEESK